MEKTLKNWTVLVTGGAVRIGRAICRAFAEEGARIVVHCHQSVDAAEDLLEKLSPRPEPHLILPADLTQAQVRASLIPDLKQKGIHLNCLINNASTYRRALLGELPESAARQDFEINFFAPFLLMKDFARHCGTGCIINLLDQRVATVEKGVGAYGLAKKTLRDATELAALEWAPDIRVNAVAPGYSLPPPGVDREKMLPLLKNIPLQKPSPPEQIARACLFLAQSETITGQTLYVDGGLHLASLQTAEKTPAKT